MTTHQSRRDMLKLGSLAFLGAGIQGGVLAGRDTQTGPLAAATKAVMGSGWGVLVYEPDADRLLIRQAGKRQNLIIWNTIPCSYATCLSTRITAGTRTIAGHGWTTS